MIIWLEPYTQGRRIFTTQAWKQTLPPSALLQYYTPVSV